MAITLTARASIISTTDGTVFTSGSFTPSANVLLVACYDSYRDAADPAEPTLSGHGTWTKVDELYWNSDIGNDRAHMYIFALNTGSSPGASTLAFTHSGTHAGALASIYELGGTDVSNGVAQCFVQFVHSNVNDTGATSSLTVNLAAASDPANRPFYAVGASGGTDHVPGASWTEINDIGIATPSKQFFTEWRSDQFDTVAFDDYSGLIRRGGIAWEVKAATTGGPPLRKLQVNVTPRRW